MNFVLNFPQQLLNKEETVKEYTPIKDFVSLAL